MESWLILLGMFLNMMVVCLFSPARTCLNHSSYLPNIDFKLFFTEHSLAVFSGIFFFLFISELTHDIFAMRFRLLLIAFLGLPRALAWA